MQQDMEALGAPSDGGFGETGDLEEAAGEGGIVGGVERGRKLWLVGGDGGAGIEIGAGDNGDFDVMKGALSFDHTAPAEGGTGFGESGDSARKFAAVGAGFEGGDGVAVEDNARAEIEGKGDEGKNGAGTPAGAFAAGTDFFGDETGEKWEKDSGEENCEEPKVEGGKPVQGEAARGERPEELDAGGLAGVESEMKEGGGE
jgi:hypothetical protein